MVQKIPPPPPIATQDPTFNRWLLELTNILNANGTIDPGNINGLDQVITQVEENTTDITALQTSTTGNTSSITILQLQVASLAGQLAVANTNIAALSARSQVFNGTGAPSNALGNPGDWYGNVGGGAGARIYIKTGVATWTAFPF